MTNSCIGNTIRFRKMIVFLLIAGTTALLISTVSAQSGVTISTQGSTSYYLGEEVILSGYNYDSNMTYLFMTGPGISANGGKLASPLTAIAGGDPRSFDWVQTNSDGSWEYRYYTYDLGINPGPYLIYAVSQPKSATALTSAENKSVAIIFKKPFVTAGITPSDVISGKPFAVTGYAEGNPESVQVWIIGANYAYTAKVPTAIDQSYTFNSTPEILKQIPKGQCYLIVQHPMQNNKLDLIRDGDWVKNVNTDDGTNGTNLFKISGAGSLQGRDAAEALTAAFGDPTVDDTYVEIPLFVVDYSGTKTDQVSGSPSGSTTGLSPGTTGSSAENTPASPMRYAPLGALALIGAVFVWRHH